MAHRERLDTRVIRARLVLLVQADLADILVILDQESQGILAIQDRE